MIPVCLITVVIFTTGLFLPPSPFLINETARLYGPAFSYWGLDLPAPDAQTVLIRSPYPYGGDCVLYQYNRPGAIKTSLFQALQFTLLQDDNCNRVARMVNIVRNSADAAQRTEFNRVFPYHKYISPHQNTWFCTVTDPERPGSFLLILLPDQGSDGGVYLFHYLAP